MPTYEYACKSCGEHLEVQQKFTDDALTECPACDGPLRKVFGSVGIAFKGSGFYKTDSRGKSSSSATSGDAGTTKTTTESSSPSDGSSKDGSSSGSSSNDASSNGTSSSTSSAAAAS